MSDFEKIFNEEEFTVPNYDNSTIVDLVRLIYNYCGMNYQETKGMREIKKYVKDKKHIILILVDGMGSDLLNKMPNKGLFYNNKKMDIQTVFPTATGCVLTSVATAKYPSSTGIYGWFGYNRKLDLNFYTLLTKERKTKEDLKINLKKIFIRPVVYSQLKRRTTIIQPSNLLNSQYTNFCTIAARKVGYSDYDDAMNILQSEINSKESTFTYLYIPYVDTLEHHNGPYNKLVYDEVSLIEEKIKQILPVNNDTEIIVIADHGQIPINNTIYMDLNKYDKYFYAFPSIDMGTCTFFVKKDKLKEFEEEFNKDFYNRLFLFRKEEFIKRNMFGKRMTKHAYDSLGEYIGLCKRGYAFYSDYQEENMLPKGNHTGLTKEELIIPVIVFKNEDKV